MSTPIIIWGSIGAAALVGALLLWLAARANKKAHAKNELDAKMISLAEKAVKAAKDIYGIELKYQEKSVEDIESILGQLNTKYRSNPFGEGLLAGSALGWGAYLGEVIRHEKPAHWRQDPSGDQTFPIVVFEGGGECYPCMWCYKRIKEGPEDNVAFKFEFLIKGPPKLGPLVSRTQVGDVVIECHKKADS